ncbi:MAG: hypothetical protein NWR72_00490 [Bacteroidia bacterium]|nr:hypothetical protein [Bacteroidia bacterium]
MKLSTLSGFFIFGILLSGCLTIKETYSFKKNGAGTMTYEVAFNKVDDTFQDVKHDLLPNTWSLDSLAEVISLIPGITKVALTSAKDHQGFGLSFRFESLTSLNHALSRILLTDSTEVFSYFRKENGVWLRAYKADRMMISESFVNKARGERQVAAMLSQLGYEVEMQFPKTIAVAYTGAEGMISGRKNKTLNMRATFQEIAATDQPLSATILLD